MLSKGQIVPGERLNIIFVDFYKRTRSLYFFFAKFLLNFRRDMPPLPVNPMIHQSQSLAICSFLSCQYLASNYHTWNWKRSPEHNERPLQAQFSPEEEQRRQRRRLILTWNGQFGHCVIVITASHDINSSHTLPHAQHPRQIDGHNYGLKMHGQHRIGRGHWPLSDL